MYVSTHSQVHHVDIGFVFASYYCVVFLVDIVAGGGAGSIVVIIITN